MRILRLYILPLAAAFAAVVCVRLLLLTQCEVRQDLPALSLQEGDRVLVLKRFGRDLRRGDVVVFRHPADTALCLGRLMALPGDSVWVSAERLMVSAARQSAADVALLLPGVCEPADVEAGSARFLHAVLRRYEGTPTRLTPDGVLTSPDGTPLKRLHFRRSYCWVADCGLVPADRLVGRAVCVSYGWRRGRWAAGRFFRPLTERP